MERFPIAAILSACLLLAACGGTAKQASIRQPAAERLANESDGVAAALRAGNTCLAATRARALRSEVSAAVSAGSIPAPLAVDARAASARLASRISCVPPPSPPATPPPAAAPTCADLHDHGKKSGDGKGEQNDQGDHAHDRGRKGCR